MDKQIVTPEAQSHILRAPAGEDSILKINLSGYNFPVIIKSVAYSKVNKSNLSRVG